MLSKTSSGSQIEKDPDVDIPHGAHWLQGSCRQSLVARRKDSNVSKFQNGTSKSHKLLSFSPACFVSQNLLIELSLPTENHTIGV